MKRIIFITFLFLISNIRIQAQFQDSIIGNFLLVRNIQLDSVSNSKDSLLNLGLYHVQQYQVSHITFGHEFCNTIEGHGEILADTSCYTIRQISDQDSSIYHLMTQKIIDYLSDKPDLWLERYRALPVEKYLMDGCPNEVLFYTASQRSSEYVIWFRNQVTFINTCENKFGGNAAGAFFRSLILKDTNCDLPLTDYKRTMPEIALKILKN